MKHVYGINFNPFTSACKNNASEKCHLLKLSAAYIYFLANVNVEANSVDQDKEQSDLGLHCLS